MLIGKYLDINLLFWLIQVVCDSIPRIFSDNSTDNFKQFKYVFLCHLNYLMSVTATKLQFISSTDYKFLAKDLGYFIKF